MKILFFIEDLYSGGKERRLVELIKGLSRNPDFEMELVLTRNRIHYQEVFETGIKIHVVERKSFIHKFSVFFRFYQIVSKFNPHIIHVWGNITALIAIPSKIILRKVMINNQITNTTKKQSKLLFGSNLTFLFSDLIVSNTQAGLEVYKAPKKKSKVIYNGFDFNRVNRLIPKGEVKEKFGIKTKFVVGMVATFGKNKDYQTYIDAAKAVLKKKSDVTFLSIGSGDCSLLEDSLNSLEKERILFLGRQNQVESIMNVCDIGVLTTNLSVHGEGISNSILEFSALAKPVIATNDGGTREIIENNYSGFLIEDRGAEELADKLIYLLNEEQERITCGLRSKTIVENKFNIETMISKYTLTYREFE